MARDEQSFREKIPIMKTFKGILVLGLFLILACNPNVKPLVLEDYVGPWSGVWPSTGTFQFQVDLNKNAEGTYDIKFSGAESSTSIELQEGSPGFWEGAYEEQLKINLDTRTASPLVFLQIGHHLEQLPLIQVDATNWQSQWNLFLAEDFLPGFYLSVDQMEDETFGASAFFQDPRLHYTFGQQFEPTTQGFQFVEIRSGIRFEATLEAETIEMEAHFLEETIHFDLHSLPYEAWKVGQVDSILVTGLSTGTDEMFPGLVEAVLNDTLLGTHSILVMQKGELLFERYFAGFDRTTLHDTRSLSKSFAGSMIGLGISDNYISDEEQLIKPFLDTLVEGVEWTDNKEDISIFHLLTMSSGLDAIDFGLDRMSFANEGAYQSQADWTQHILSAPMLWKPGLHSNYGSGNPHLLGPILEAVLPEPLPFYIHRKLFGPLGIEAYRIQTDNGTHPYFGGGWYLRPIDLLKFGDLYRLGGTWGEEQILSPEWVAKSLARHAILENTTDQNPYGFLFWHKTYDLKGHQIASIEGRGSGGQYLFIVPDLELIAVITSGNYRNGRGFQPERIMETFILPAFVQ